MKQTHTRNPSGVVKAKPIALRLLPEERAQAERLAQECGHTASAIARKAYLKGMPLVADELRIPMGHLSENAPCPLAHNNGALGHGNV